jgi:hypothetical protein
LVTVLEAGEIGGAALDVYEQEPLPPDHRLRSDAPPCRNVACRWFRVFRGREHDSSVYSSRGSTSTHERVLNFWIERRVYGIAPTKMLELLSAVAGEAADGSIYGLHKALDKLKDKAPHLVQDRRFQKLATQAFLD